MQNEVYSLKFTPMAAEDLEEIYQYISSKLFAEPAANNLMDEIEAKIMRLKQIPFSYSLVLDEPLKTRGYRKIVIENYIAFYLVNEAEKVVIIMRILYGARDYQSIL